jgi:DNA-binding transcriptional LysR family regulator
MYGSYPMWSSIELRELRVFLAVAEELHFGRAADRLHINRSRVSQIVAELEAKVGGRLFERTSRTVTLTALGVGVRDQVAPAHAQLVAALHESCRLAEQEPGLLRVGFTATTAGPALSRVVAAFTARHPGCEVSYAEVSMADPYFALRRGEIDVLCNWLILDEADLVSGPGIDHRRRVLAVGRRHRLAAQSSVSIEDLGGELAYATSAPSFPAALQEALLPRCTPSGQPIRRFSSDSHSLTEFLPLVAAGQVVHATVEGVPLLSRDDVVLIPITDLPPMPLGLIWSAAAENHEIRALAEVARSLQVKPPHQSAQTATS